MDVLTGPAAAAAVLLVAGGAPKVIRPGDTARAMAALRLPIGRLGVRLAGALEVAIGVGFLVAPGRALAIGVAATYTAFAGVVGLALRSRLPLATCGCFGSADTPPTVAHLGLVVTAALTASAFAVDPASTLLPAGLAAATGFALLVAAVAWFGYLVMSRLAVLQGLGR